MLVKGNVIKSVNQYFNKQAAKYYSALRIGKDPKENQYTSKKLQKLTLKRNINGMIKIPNKVHENFPT